MSSLLEDATEELPLVDELSYVQSAPCVLLVDDDEAFLYEVRENFRARGYHVDTARTPEESVHLYKEKKGMYQLVVYDVNFSDSSELRGDQFIEQVDEIFGKTMKVLISGGEWLTPDRRKHLQGAGIKILEKSPTVNERLAELTKHQAKEKWHGIEKILSPVMSDIEKRVGRPVQLKIVPASLRQVEPDMLLVAKESLKRTLIKWLKTRSEPHVLVFAYGDRVYSPNDMAVEVANESEVGLEHIRMLLKVFEHSLGIEEIDPQLDEDDEDDDSLSTEEYDSQLNSPE